MVTRAAVTTAAVILVASALLWLSEWRLRGELVLWPFTTPLLLVGAVGAGLVLRRTPRWRRVGLGICVGSGLLLVTGALLAVIVASTATS